MSTSPISGIVAFATGLVAGLSVNAIVAFFQRPVIEIASDDDRYDPNIADRHLHVRVRNKRQRIFNRNMAVDCESQVWLADTETGLIKGGSPFKTKWARLSNITYVESTRRLEWLPIHALETRINIYPGHSDGGMEGLQLDIVRRYANTCFVHDPEVYRTPVSERDKWNIKDGTYFVRVMILYAQKHSDSALFLLTIGSTFEATTLVTCPLNRLGRAMQIFGLDDAQRHPRNFDSKSEDIWA